MPSHCEPGTNARLVPSTAGLSVESVGHVRPAAFGKNMVRKSPKITLPTPQKMEIPLKKRQNIENSTASTCVHGTYCTTLRGLLASRLGTNDAIHIKTYMAWYLVPATMVSFGVYWVQATYIPTLKCLCTLH